MASLAITFLYFNSFSDIKNIFENGIFNSGKIIYFTYPLVVSIASYFSGGFVNIYFAKMEYEVDLQQENMLEVKVFAENIGKGDYTADIVTKDESTKIIRAALLEMRDNISVSKIKEQETKWKIETQASINDIITRYNKIDELTFEITKFLTNTLNATQGMYFQSMMNDEKMTFNLISCFAYNRQKHLEKQYKLGESLIGRAAVEKKYIYTTEIPSDHFIIASDIVSDPVNIAVIVIPLLSNNQVNGVMCFNSTQNFNTLQIELLNEISESIALAIFKQTVNEKTKDLLEEVNNSQKLMQLLLENATEIISINELDGSIRYVSPSVENILGYNSSKLTGTFFQELLKHENIELFTTFFENLLSSPGKAFTAEIPINHEKSNELWLEFSGKNLINDKAINGILINAHDITMRHRAKEEEKRRGQMQALSENSPDFILRINRKFNIFYANPAIEKLSSLKPEQLIGEEISEKVFSTSFIEMVKNLTEQVVRTKVTTVAELEYNTHSNEVINLNLTAIPELNTEHIAETILFVAHDVTEVKRIQQEIQNKNKKISDSIQYAKSIQTSIMPSEAELAKHFNDYMMMFLPRDIVSGDFPWTFVKGDDLYFAAVDCTGHGVPGAFMSLIGHFLLNESIAQSSVNQPALLLDYLHAQVNKVLKQEENKESRDGMDVALCMYRKETQELHFSGAHRPLFLVRNGEVIEFKGDKRPIGGTHYNKKATDFSNTVIKLESGDAFFIYSDGLPDQIGGPEKKKFSNVQIKELLAKHWDKPLQEIKSRFEKEFFLWLGNQKQLDDVLLIGVKIKF